MFKKTIAKSIVIEGKTMYEGNPTSIQCLPYDKGIAIEYRGVRKLLSPEDFNEKEKGYTTSVQVGDNNVVMTEHLLSAIIGLGINSILIKTTSPEIPFSANAELFTNSLKNIDLVDTDVYHKQIKIDRTLRIDGQNGKYCIITPSDKFEITITVDFPFPIGRQSYYYVQSKENYLSEIAHARSILIFAIDDIDPWENYKVHFPQFPAIIPQDPKKCPFIAYNKTSFITPLHNNLEPVQHKLLDFIGDLAFLGQDVQGCFHLYKPGHAFNRKVVKVLDLLF
jgi:UDP-3-O-acyl-N-acetylglucosamine deacetylase